MPASTRSPVLVGRQAELAAAGQLIDSVSGGRGATLLVTGEAGIGKSRLMAEVAVLAAQAGLTVLTGRAVPGGGTYRAVAEAVARPLRARPMLSSGRLQPYQSALCWLIPAGNVTSTEPLPGLELDRSVVLGEGMLALLDELHGGAGCLLVLEDLHWADADTLSLVHYLTGAVPATPVLLALTARDDATTLGRTSLGISELATHPAVTTLRLTRLDPVEVAALARVCRDGAPLPEPDLRELVARSEGLPFLVEELLDAASSPSRVPPTLASLVASRLAALPVPQRPVLLAAAVADDLDWQLLSAVTRLDEATVLDALRTAAGAGLLSTSDQAGDRALRWRHALTRDAVLATLLPPERSALAARAAEALGERGDPQDSAASAELFIVAGQPRRAAEIWFTLARRDTTRGALRSAAELLAKAGVTGQLAGPVAAEQVRVLTLLGRASEALDIGTTALRGDGPVGAVVGHEHAELCLRLARAAVSGGRWPDAEGYLERAGRPADPRSLVLAADAAYGAGDVERATSLADAAVRAAERGSAPPEILCEALTILSSSMFGTDPGAASSALRRATQIAAEHALTPWRVEALFLLGAQEQSAGHPDAPSLVAVREIAAQAGMLAHIIRVDLIRADTVLVIKGPRAARPLAQRVAERAGQLRLPGLQAMAELWVAAGAAAAGELATMTELLSLAASREHAPPEVTGHAAAIRALPHLLGHDLPAAAAVIDTGVPGLLRHRSAAPIGFFGLWALLRTAVADRDEQARQALRGHQAISAVINQAALGYAEAIVAGRAGRGADAAAQFATADAAIVQLPWWNRLLRSIALDAAVTDRWGDPVPALRADLAAHEQAGEPGLARICRDLLRIAGAPTRRGRGDSPVPPPLRARGITSRETDVLTLVAAGLTNAQIATRLFLSPRTVETHVTSLLAKTGSATRGELRGWAATPPP